MNAYGSCFCVQAAKCGPGPILSAGHGMGMWDSKWQVPKEGLFKGNDLVFIRVNWLSEAQVAQAAKGFARMSGESCWCFYWTTDGFTLRSISHV